jgi:hypothetical protein
VQQGEGGGEDEGAGVGGGRRGGGTAMPVQIFTVDGCEVHVETRLGGLWLLYGMAFGRGNI